LYIALWGALDGPCRTVRLGKSNFDISFSFRCPKCDYQNEEISANDLTSGNAECGMCETIFKLEGIDAIKITAILE
jgi:transcription elongation factor Elf1